MSTLLIGVLMILAGSLEFEKGHNNEVQGRPSDNSELPEVRQWAMGMSVFNLTLACLRATSV